MSVRPGPHVSEAGAAPADRRAERRELVTGNLWMIDGRGATILRCVCLDASSSGMRLRVPVGYGVQKGQRYELTSHLPGQSAPPGLGLMVSRRAEIVRTQIVPSDDEYDVDVGVQLAPVRTAMVNNGDPITTGG
jgi:hypothetical protein